MEGESGEGGRDRLTDRREGREEERDRKKEGGKYTSGARGRDHMATWHGIYCAGCRQTKGKKTVGSKGEWAFL